jgi:DNA-directed RNA polymerase specialized sigma54-like protein
MAKVNTPTPEAQVQELYELAESRTAQAFEELVSKPSFGVLLARSAENVAAVARISSDIADLVLRNLRLAGRADVTRLARQLHRTEDKLERLLQEIEQLHDELARGRASANGSSVVAPDTRPARTTKAST